MKYKGLILILSGLLVGVLLGALVFFSGPNNYRPASNRRLPPTIGSPVKGFQLHSPAETPFSLSDFRGKPVVINFWATWCTPCKEEMPLLEEFYNRYPNQMVIIGINSGEDKATVDQFLGSQKITFPILLDLDGNVSDEYFVKNFPMTFFIDKDGILRAQHIGMLTEDRLHVYLRTIGVEP